jgi:plasmid stabilization system protein ParE
MAAIVRQLEIGFFSGDDAVPAPMSEQFTTRVVGGIPTLTQFFRVNVHLEDQADVDGEIWIVCTALPTGSRKLPLTAMSLDEGRLRQVRAALAVALPNAALCFTTEDQEGFSRVIVPSLIIQPRAQLDIDDALAWYHPRDPALVPRFLAELDSVFDRITQNAAQFPVEADPIRRALLRKFPFAVFFIDGGDLAASSRFSVKHVVQ